MRTKLLTVLRDDLFTALQLMDRLTRGPAFSPELKIVRLFTDGSALQLVARTDQGGLALTVGATGQSALDVLIPIEPLTAITKLAPAGSSLQLVPDGSNALRLEYERNRSRLVGVATVASGGRHTWPAFEGAVTSVTLSADALRASLPMVIFAAATDDARPLLQSVNIVVADGQAELAATNGFHVMVRRLPAHHGEPWAAIMPLRMAETLAAILDALEVDGDTVMLRRAETALMTEYGPAVLWSQTLEGTYPDYRRVLPAGDLPIRAQLPQPDLRRLAAAAAIVNQTEAALQIRPGLVAMYAEDDDRGDVHPVCPAQADQAFTTFINPKWVGAAIKVMPRGDLTLGASQPQAPVMVSPAADTLYLLMPLHMGSRPPRLPEPALDLFQQMEQSPPAGSADPDEAANPEFFAAAQATYSADRIPSGKIKKPFAHKGCLWVNTGNLNGTLECVRAVARGDWPGAVTTYADRSRLPGTAGGAFSYAGLLVRHGKNEYILTGEKLQLAAASGGLR